MLFPDDMTFRDFLGADEPRRPTREPIDRDCERYPAQPGADQRASLAAGEAWIRSYLETK